MDAFLLCVHLTFLAAATSIHPDCAVIVAHMEAQETCVQTRRSESRNRTRAAGCRTDWDEIRCWSRAEVGQVVNVSCAEVFQLFSHNQGYVFRNCTKEGWTDLYPPYEEACDFGQDVEPESEFYTAGYATSLVSLISAILVFAAFRKFHCTRNYIHINLFASFILRASAVFIKDSVLFADETLDHCLMSTSKCKSAVAFFQFSILANYFWLLVEGVYLQILLALTFVSQGKYFWWYILTGWGMPSFILTVWVVIKNFFDDRGCWDDNENAFIWWIIKGPITASLLVNFIIFINVIRILVQKLRSPAVRGSESGHFMRLAKSTLFLIPLFGMHYILFAFLPEDTGETARLYIELGLGSFQGFVVALLYCFLNGEVQSELRRRLHKWHTQNHLSTAKHRITLTQITVLEKPELCPGSVACV
ncbi:growth hormone releasing hormone receptor a isoform X2 [Denticeps clupeoides]|uniref:growth hormone releasing hormone receptor a isoform X2 n=1 Tax=Denticeps clupeoides TaxID=299321 RepID=UPI0010A54785|nr:vasoactive intestinal polypeptide receptor 1-like isoform X2 [Denticeps clupeoides]